MYLHAKYYQNIQRGLKSIVIFTNLLLINTPDKVIYKEIWYLKISLVRSYQYVSAGQTLLFYLSFLEL